jgi:hypothetical protein
MIGTAEVTGRKPTAIVAAASPALDTVPASAAGSAPAEPSAAATAAGAAAIAIGWLTAPRSVDPALPPEEAPAPARGWAGDARSTSDGGEASNGSEPAPEPGGEDEALDTDDASRPRPPRRTGTPAAQPLVPQLVGATAARCLAAADTSDTCEGAAAAAAAAAAEAEAEAEAAMNALPPEAPKPAASTCSCDGSDIGGVDDHEVPAAPVPAPTLVPAAAAVATADAPSC